MNTYAIGDIQGCYIEFSALLDEIDFDTDSDHLWLVGDLINRGPDNVGVMDLIMSLPNVTAVLGNHDLHFLAVATGQQRLMRSDTLIDLLESPKLPDYIEYLRQLPLIHYDEARNTALVHAGIPPQLSIDDCLALSAEVESTLQSGDFMSFLSAMYGNEPDTFVRSLTGMDRLRVITNCLTRIRYCTANGKLELTHKTDVEPEGYVPWFSFPRSDQLKILFGHWAALEGQADAEFVTALDTGCVWGREMLALRVDDGKIFTVPATGNGS